MSLITAYEVLKYSPAGRDYPTVQFCELIPQIEEQFARECLGQDLYDYFVSKLTPYPTDAVEYDSTVGYAVDEIVIYNGCLFVCIADNCGSNPILDTDQWEAFDRFTDAAVNAFWMNYLRRCLALKVYSASLIYTTWRAGAGGVVISAGDSQGFRSATKAELSDIKTGLIAEIERVEKNMLIWLRDNGTDAGFPSTLACANMCQTPGRTKRRWAFKY